MMGSLNLDEYNSASFYSSRHNRRYFVNENLVVDYNSRNHPHRQSAPLPTGETNTGYRQRPSERGPTTGYKYAQSQPAQSSIANPAAYEVSWQQREQQQQQHQRARATRSAPVLITRLQSTPHVGGVVQSSRRDRVNDGRQWPAPNPGGSRPVTPISVEYADSRLRHVTSSSLNHKNRERPTGRHVSPAGSILKLTPRHDRVAVVEASTLSSWIDDKSNSSESHRSSSSSHPATTPAASARGFFRGRSIDCAESRAPDLPSRQSRSRAFSSSPTRHHQQEPLPVPPTGTASGSSPKPVATTPRNQRRVLFKNNVAVYRFDSDHIGGVGESAANVSGTSSLGASMSASSELLNGEPRRHHHHHHQGNRAQQQHQQQRVGSAGARPQSSGLDDVRRLPLREAYSGRPRVMPVWNGPTFGAELVGSSLRKPVGGPPSDRCQSPALSSVGGESRASLWVDDVGSTCQMQSIGESSTIARVRYAEVQDLTSHRLMITCFLRSGSYWDADDIVVKANRAGSRVRIVFGGADMAGPSDQLILPVTVDSYRLVARLQPNTRLVIEAPVIHR